MYDKPRESPFKTPQYHSLDNSKQNIIREMELVFVYYCGKGSKYNYLELQQKYFMELVTELFSLAGKEKQISRTSQKWVRIATLYYTKGRNKPLYLTQFLELLPGLARCLYIRENSSGRSFEQELDEEKAMKALLRLFQKLYHHILDEEIYRRGMRSEQIEDETKQFLLKLKESLARLYQVYFDNELTLNDRDKEYFDKSFESMLTIMKDFEVYPKLISASQLFFIFKEIINDRENNHLALLSPSNYTLKSGFPKLGTYLTLTRFVQALILISHVCVCKLKRVEGEDIVFRDLNINQKESVKLFLEYMETMRSVKEKYCKFSKERFTLIVYEEYSDYVGKEQSLKSSPTKGNNSSRTMADPKKSFYNILNRIDL